MVFLKENEEEIEVTNKEFFKYLHKLEKQAKAKEIKIKQCLYSVIYVEKKPLKCSLVANGVMTLKNAISNLMNETYSPQFETKYKIKEGNMAISFRVIKIINDKIDLENEILFYFK